MLLQLYFEYKMGKQHAVNHILNIKWENSMLLQLCFEYSRNMVLWFEYTRNMEKRHAVSIMF
jgi:hypothetical protein